MNLENKIEILLVEDNPDDAELTFRAFRKNNWENIVHWVKDGEKALEFLFDTDDKGKHLHRPKVVLLDLNLPKVTGLQVLKKIKDNEFTRSIPVVVLTSSNEERDIAESYKLGVNSYIIKAVDFTKFLSSIREIGLYWLELNRQAEG